LTEKVITLFTPRELSVLYWYARGYTNREIANQLHISVSTVKSHKASISNKLLGTGIHLESLRRLSPEILWAMKELNG